MDKIASKYLYEMNEIQEQFLDGNGNIKEEYKGKIQDKFNEVTLNYINEMRVDIENGYNPKNEKYKKELVNLKILWNLLDDFGFEYSRILFNEISEENWRAHAKTRLFMMFVKSLGEIIYLLEGGYSSCALGRIRYIYELGVYLEIINKNSQDISRKFLQFSNSNRIKLAKELENQRLKKKAVKDFKKLKIYTDIWDPYGWAKDIFPNEKITFRKLAKTTTLCEYYSIYTFSSWSIHADIYGSANNIDLYPSENDGTWVTTPSIVGTDIVIIHLLLFINKITINYFTVENECIKIFVSLVNSKLIDNILDTLKDK
ncbi:hypothetical protein NPD5_4189 [Clostridium sporogenes]|uniref:Uncharacterized protein n=1 Tax=Clostridium sporogenes TaxID=1509 RepID=A0A1L3NDQ5_CLOSG|nr:DUF5677 domain-containing protein [Clostridium sporogenes]APH14252.1 hypothetical protein NPD5_4189 [Clostridium sporogenes]